jgi:hypothetical protein
MKYAHLFDIFNNYSWSDSKSNVSNLDRYLRALCQSMMDHVHHTMSDELLYKILTEAEYSEPLEYNPEWEELLPLIEEGSIDDEKYTSFDRAIMIIKALIVDYRAQEEDYRKKNAELGMAGIPFYDFKGKVADWKNTSLEGIVTGFESYILGSSENLNKLDFDEDTSRANWDFIPDLLIVGIMYE